MRTVRLAGLLVILFRGISAPAFTTNDAVTMFNTYQTQFYSLSGSTGYFKDTQTGGGATYFWEQAEEIECVIDAYEFSSNATYTTMITDLLNGFVNSNGTNWSSDIYNDDCMWACIAFARGYQDTGIASFKNIAQSNFDMVYARGYDTNLGGGIWWTTAKTNKNAAVNGPASIAAFLLYEILRDATYLGKSANILNWESNNLFVASTGEIHDSMNANGTVVGGATTYNQGTFIGAANLLGLTPSATAAANYTMNSMCTAGILPQYGTNDNNSGFNAIFIRWMTKFIATNGLQSTYLQWLQNNANAAWNARRNSDNLSWCQWPLPTPSGPDFYSWDCISSFEAVEAVAATQSTSPGTVTLTASDPIFGSSFTNAGNWSSGAAPNSSNNYVVTGLNLRTPASSYPFFAGSSLLLTNGGGLRLTTTTGPTTTVGTELFVNNGIVAAWNRPATLAGLVNLQAGGGIFDPQASSSFTVSAAITGTGALTVASDDDNFGGTLVLAGVNTYTGGTVINGPDTLVLSNATALGSSNGPLTFNNNGTGLTIPFTNYGTSVFGSLNLNGTNLGVGSLAGGGGQIFNNGGGMAVLTIGNGGNGGGMFLGKILDNTSSSGAVALVKTGSATITLAGANFYSGGTTISGGTLQFGDGISNNGAVIGNITNNAQLVFANPFAQTYGKTISGVGTLTKTGPGVLTLSGTNLYTGNTTLSAGTLALSGISGISNSPSISLAAGATIDATARNDGTMTLNNNQTLIGSGIVNGNFSASAGSVVATGSSNAALTVQGNVILNGSLLMKINPNASPANDELVSVGGTITGSGTITVSNLGPALQAGDMFQLFNGPVTGSMTIALPAPGTGNAWVNNLTNNGTISVVSTAPASLTAQINASNITVSWPSNNTGWELEAQTNAPGAGISTNWIVVNGSALTNQMTMPINAGAANVFFRLVYP